VAISMRRGRRETRQSERRTLVWTYSQVTDELDGLVPTAVYNDFGHFIGHLTSDERRSVEQMLGLWDCLILLHCICWI